MDRKLSSKDASTIPNKSRFNKISRWFSSCDFNRKNVGLFLAEMKAKNATPSYMNKMITMFKHLDRFYAMNYSADYPKEQLRDYSYFHEPIQIKETLKPEEIIAISEAVRPYKKNAVTLNIRQKALIMFIALTGCRIGEALGLRWTDIGSEPPFVIFRETKNGEDRVVPIDQATFDRLNALPHRCEFVFSSYRSNKLEHQEINLDLKSRVEQVGITKNVTAHTFRHSFVTTMRELDVDFLDIAHIVGHRDPKTTMRYQNSHIAYYAEIIHLHPLLRGALTIDQVAKRIKAHVDKVVDSRSYAITFSQNGDEINFSIKKI